MGSFDYGYCLVFIISFSNFIPLIDSSASETLCLSLNNEKWNKIKKRCVECPECDPGQFRNITEPYTRRTGAHGAEQCIRCRPCPEGTYSKTGYGSCIKCRMNCTNFNREVDETCSRFHDNKCGSCLSGYDDIFKNTQFPCGRKRKEPRYLDPPERTPENIQDVHQIEKENTDSDRESSSDKITGGLQPTGSKQGTHTRVPVTTIVLICIGVIVPSFVVGLLLRSYISRTQLRRSHPGLVNKASDHDLTQDTDLEMDTLGQADNTVPKGYNLVPQGEPADARPELEPSREPAPRPELSHTPSSNNPEELVFLGLQSSPSEVWCYKKSKDICRCRVEKRCNCASYNIPSTENIERSDKYVLEVGPNICHDPIPLFCHLGLGDPVIFQENDTRNRAPEEVTEQALVTNLLHRWIEVKGNPTLQELQLALCKADFHKINDKLYELYLGLTIR